MMNPVENTASDAGIDAITLKSWLHDGAEIGLLDVREHGQYGEAHIFQAVPVPYSRLEADITRLAPRRDARLVVYDEDDGVAARAQQALKRLGYSEVSRLLGGIGAWTAAGFNVFAGVNVPSKTFGELAEIEFHTPRISARDLAARLDAKEDLIVLDGRPFSEFQKMSIPGAICCPNGELALHAHTLAPDPATTIVVNCAGRTRSIIGAQTLINLGIPNPVLALENGTQGWYLEDLSLEHGAARRHDVKAPESAVNSARERADALAQRAGVETISAAQASEWLADATRTTFLCDVRTPEEFKAGSLPGAQHTPGGQLIQATDQYIAVRGARLILLDDDGVRAPVVASWLRQLGWQAVVLQDGIRADLHAPAKASPEFPKLPICHTADLARAIEAGAQLVDVRPSQTYREQHIEHARWSVRPRLSALGLNQDAHVVLIASDMAVAQLAATDLAALGVTHVSVNDGTAQQWRDAGLSVISTPASPPDAECIDFLFFVHDRHDGNKQAARQYLAWETNLIHQIDPQERATFDFTLTALSNDSKTRT